MLVACCEERVLDEEILPLCLPSGDLLRDLETTLEFPLKYSLRRLSKVVGGTHGGIGWRDDGHDVISVGRINLEYID